MTKISKTSAPSTSNGLQGQPDALPAGNRPLGAPSPLAELIIEHRAARAAASALDPAMPEDEGEPFWDREDVAFCAVVGYPCSTIDEIAMKADFLVNVPDNAERMFQGELGSLSTFISMFMRSMLPPAIPVGGADISPSEKSGVAASSTVQATGDLIASHRAAQATMNHIGQDEARSAEYWQAYDFEWRLSCELAALNCGGVSDSDDTEAARQYEYELAELGTSAPTDSLSRLWDLPFGAAMILRDHYRTNPVKADRAATPHDLAGILREYKLRAQILEAFEAYCDGDGIAEADHPATREAKADFTTALTALVNYRPASIDEVMARNDFVMTDPTATDLPAWQDGQLMKDLLMSMTTKSQDAA